MKILRTYLRGAVAAGLPFGLLMSWFFHFQFGWQIGTAAGVSAGVLFGLCFGAVAVIGGSRRMRAHPEFTAETLLRDDAANHFVGWQAVGGWLYLTDQRVLFRPHAFNLQAKEWTAALDTVKAAAPMRILGFIPNGLRIDAPGGSHHFLIRESRSWESAISEAIRGKCVSILK